MESFLDQIDSNIVMDTSLSSDNAGNLIAVSLRAVLKSKGSGRTLTDWNAGFNAVVTTGTLITHGLKNAAGAAAAPTAAIAVNGSGTNGISCLCDALGTTTFNIAVSANCNVYWIAILL